MTLRILSILCLAVSAFAGEVVRDRIEYKQSGPRDCWIISESKDEYKWKDSPNSAGDGTTSKRSEVRSIRYGFQLSSGPWSLGMEAREGGKFAISADLFNQLASGSREAEKVVGSIEEGISLDLDGQYGPAATAFQRVVDGFPNHPLALDAAYRMGMVLALGKQADAAEALAKKLDEQGKQRVGPPATVRAAAIRTALAFVAGKESDMRNQYSKAAFNPDFDRACWLHFNLWAADNYRAQGKGKAAVEIYEKMVKYLGGEPAAAARVRLGLGVCKADTDHQGAILDLLGLDALPFGSPEQKCEARYHAGRLILAEAQAAEKQPDTAKDERKLAFMKENYRTARLLLEAAANAVVEHPTKAQAKELLATIPPEEVPKDAKEGDAAAAAGEAPADAQDPADPKKPDPKKPADPKKPDPKKAADPSAPKAP